MKIIFRYLIICLSILYILTYSTQLYSQNQLIPYHKNKLWGYCNAQKQIIIPPQYHFADKFTHGRAWVQNAQKKWAMIDSTGKQLTQFAYTDYSLFNDTLFKVQIYFPNKKTPHHYEKYYSNLVNLKGEEQLAWQYRVIEDAGNGWWKVERLYFKDSIEREYLENYTLLINPKNKAEMLFPTIDNFNNNIAKYKYKSKYVDTTGKIILDFSNQFYFCYGFNEKRAKVRFNKEQEGFINIYGQVITKKRYEVITHDSQFKEGLAVVRYEKKYGYIDLNGNEVITPQYKEATNFSEGLALVGNGELYGVINKHNQLIVPFLYDDIKYFHNGFAIFTQKGLKGVINRQGKEIVAAQYDNIDNFEGGMAAVHFDNKVGFIDTTGRLVIPIQYAPKGSWYNHPSAYKPLQFKQNIAFIPHYGWIGKDGKEFFDDDSLPVRTPEDLRKFSSVRLANGKNLSTYRQELLAKDYIRLTNIRFIDLDNDNRNELIISYYTGGMHCCDENEIYGLNDNNEYQLQHSGLDFSLQAKDANGKIRLSISYYEALSYFHTCYACWAGDAPSSFDYYYDKGRLLLVPTDTELNESIEANLLELSKLTINPLHENSYESPDVRGQKNIISIKDIMDGGERKSYLFNLLAYYMNNHRDREKTKALFDKYYLYEADKLTIWREIANIIAEY